jgi:excisionase family DNA binding protein
MALLSIREASKQLGVSTEHIRRMIKAGKWPAIELGPRATRVDPEEIIRLGRLVAESKKETLGR